jgi:hypothetical protein
MEQRQDKKTKEVSEVAKNMNALHKGRNVDDRMKESFKKSFEEGFLEGQSDPADLKRQWNVQAFSANNIPRFVGVLCGHNSAFPEAKTYVPEASADDQSESLLIYNIFYRDFRKVISGNLGSKEGDKELFDGVAKALGLPEGIKDFGKFAEVMKIIFRERKRQAAQDGGCPSPVEGDFRSELRALVQS